MLIKLNLWSGFQKMEQRSLHFLCSSAVCHEVPSLAFPLSSHGLMPFLPNLFKSQLFPGFQGFRPLVFET